MNTNDKIEELFEAAKRHEKDMQRQQRLSDLVDQLAAAESATRKPTKRRPIWAAMGIAASILLMVSIGLRALHPDMPDNTKHIVALNNSSSIVIDSTSHRAETTTDISSSSVKTALHKDMEILIAESAIDDSNTATEPTLEHEFPIHDNNLIAENETQENEEVNVATTEKKVYVRTSNRLVGNGSQQRSHHSSSENTPLMAFSGTGTSVLYDLGKITFNNH